MEPHAVVSHEEWLLARTAHLAREKEFTRARDALASERRALPWERVEKSYVFDAPEGRVSLADLLDGRGQLIVKHFMMGPDWEEGCVGCSFHSDHIDASMMHLEHHDVSFAAVSRAPLAKIDAYKARMGWRFRWVSSFGGDFNYDYQVSFTAEQMANGATYNYERREIGSDEMSGMSVFLKDATGDIFHTYSCYARGADSLIGAYSLLDLTPKGRAETGPNHNLTDWVRRHDRYDGTGR
ncbi:MAG: thioredoxin family protein [Acetobacteraceae bacterium]